MLIFYSNILLKLINKIIVKSNTICYIIVKINIFIFEKLNRIMR